MKMFTAPKPQITTKDIADFSQRLDRPIKLVTQVTTTFSNNLKKSQDKFPNNQNNKQGLSLLANLKEKLDPYIQRPVLKNIKQEEVSSSQQTMRKP